MESLRNTTIREGSRVKLKEGIYPETTTNPTTCLGTVRTPGKYTDGTVWWVRWDNGESNNYVDSDLTLVFPDLAELKAKINADITAYNVELGRQWHELADKQRALGKALTLMSVGE